MEGRAIRLSASREQSSASSSMRKKREGRARRLCVWEEWWWLEKKYTKNIQCVTRLLGGICEGTTEGLEGLQCHRRL